MTYENFAEKSTTKLGFEPSAFDVTLNDDVFVVGDVVKHLLKAIKLKIFTVPLYIFTFKLPG